MPSEYDRLFKRLTRTPPGQWRREDLEKLSGEELEALALLLGIPHTGTKARLVARLLDAADLRTVLAEFEEPEPLAAGFKLAELRALARRAGSFRWSTKYGVAAGLLNWRNACRSKGQAALRQARAEAAGRPRQLSFRFE